MSDQWTPFKVWLVITRFKATHLHWSVSNWLHGYAFGPVRRCRECGHTTPSHYGRCSKWRAGR